MVSLLAPVRSTSSRHARLQALLEATVAAGVARARVDDAISGQLARVSGALHEPATKELLHVIHENNDQRIHGHD